MKTYEIMVNGAWSQVSHDIFRSHTGPRCLNGKAYHGKRFVFLRDELAAGIMTDICCDCGEALVKHHDPDPFYDVLCLVCQVAREQAHEDAYMAQDGAGL